MARSHVAFSALFQSYGAKPACLLEMLRRSRGTLARSAMWSRQVRGHLV